MNKKEIENIFLELLQERKQENIYGEILDTITKQQDNFIIPTTLTPTQEINNVDFNFNSFVCDFETSKYKIPKKNPKLKNDSYIGYICIFTYALLSSMSKKVEHKNAKNKFIGVNEKDFNPYVYDCLDKPNLFFDCLENMLKIMKSKNRFSKTIYLWFYNSAKFDNYYIMNELINNGYIANYNNDKDKTKKLFSVLGNSKIHYLSLKFYYNGYEFIVKDFLKFTFTSLEQLGNIIGMNKLSDIGKKYYDRDYKTLNDSERVEYKEYAKRDIEIMFKALPLWNNLMELEKPKYITLQSLCVKQFKKLCSNKKDLFKIDYNKWFGEHYKGGLTILNPLYKEKVIENVYSYDINSSYPYAMKQKLPTKQIELPNDINYMEWENDYINFGSYITNNQINQITNKFINPIFHKYLYLLYVVDKYNEYLIEFKNEPYKLNNVIYWFNDYDNKEKENAIKNLFKLNLKRDSDITKLNLIKSEFINLNILMNDKNNILENQDKLNFLREYTTKYNFDYNNPNNYIKLFHIQINQMKIKNTNGNNTFTPLFPIPFKQNEFYKEYKHSKAKNKYTFFIWEQELKDYLNFYDIDYDILDTKYFKSEYVFNDYVDYYYFQKSNYSFEKEIIKIVLDYLNDNDKNKLNESVNNIKKYWLNENNKMLTKPIKEYEKQLLLLINYYCFEYENDKQELIKLLETQLKNLNVKINVVKLFLNSLYGKFGENPHHKTYIFLNEKTLKENQNIIINKPLKELKLKDTIIIKELNKDNELIEKEYIIETIKQNQNKEQIYIFECLEKDLNIKYANNVFIASYITCLARHNLYNVIFDLKDNFIYSDTDSVKSFIEIDNKYIDNLELGKWKFEYKKKYFKCLRAKSYIATNDKDNLNNDKSTKIKISGFNIYKSINSLNDFVIGKKLEKKNKLMCVNNVPYITITQSILQGKELESENENDNDLESEFLIDYLND